jgi:hypothetical protein
MASRKLSIWMYVGVGDRWRYAKPVEGHRPELRVAANDGTGA